MATRALVNGKIVTVDERFSIASALAVDGDRVTATGTSAAILAGAGPAAEVVDLGGRTVIPGLIDNHNHFVRATERAEVRLDGVRSRADALSALGRGAAELAPGQWLLTLGGWHEEQWAGDRRELTLAELDAVAGGRPAFIQAQYDHAVVNTAWLDATGAPADAQSRATGRVGGGLVTLNRAASGFPAPADREAAVRAAMSWYNRLGLTTVFDPGGVGVAAASYATIAAMAARGELTLRLLTTLGDGAGGGGAARLAERIRRARPFDGDQWYDRIAVGEIYHAAFHWDHPASPPRPSGDDIAAAGEILRAAAGGGWPVQTHSVTTRGLDLVFDAYERADRHHPIRPLRWSVTHAEGITAAHLERARRLGVTVQLRSQGVIRAARSAPAPLRLVCDSGLSWGLGTDGTRAAQVNPFVTLWWAVTGRSLGGERTLDEPLTRDEALIAHTRSNAQLMFRENDLGSIRPGLLADLLILDRDYLTIPADEIRDITPVATMVGGRVVHGSLASLLPCLHGNPAERIGGPADRRAQLRGAGHGERGRQPADFRHVDRPRRRRPAVLHRGGPAEAPQHGARPAGERHGDRLRGPGELRRAARHRVDVTGHRPALRHRPVVEVRREGPGRGQAGRGPRGRPRRGKQGRRLRRLAAARQSFRFSWTGDRLGQSRVRRSRS
jgi:predicted amidohydrolase YtcJ